LRLFALCRPAASTGLVGLREDQRVVTAAPDDLCSLPFHGMAELVSAVRDHFVGMCAELVDRLTRDGVDGGMIALLGSADAAIEAIDPVRTVALAGRLLKAAAPRLRWT
jgi:hypothetical protein